MTLGSETTVDDALTMDISTTLDDQWTVLPKPRDRGKAVYIPGQDIAYFMGGSDQNDSTTINKVESIDLGIVLVDADFNIVMANLSIEKIFRCDISEVIGTKCYEKFAKRQEICVSCPGQQALKTGQPEDIETERVRSDGSRFVVRIQAFPLFDDNGKSTGFIGLIEDVTKRREAEEQIKEIITSYNETNTKQKNR